MVDTSSRLAARIIKGLAIGVLAGVATHLLGLWLPELLPAAKRFSVAVLDPVGQVFLRLLFFVVIPLVFSSLAAGVAQLGRVDKIGPIAARTFLLFFMNMAIAVCLGLLVMQLVSPGTRLSPGTQEALLAEYGGRVKAVATPAAGFSTLVDMFMPRNLLGAVSGSERGALGEVLPLILFAILVGAAATRLVVEKRKRLIEGLEMVTELMTGIVHFALCLAPLAVPAMIYSVIVKIGPGILASLGLFVLVCLGALLLHLFGVMSLWLRFLAGVSPRRFFLDTRAVLVTAFSTSSSNATLPAALECARGTLGLRHSTAGFVLPLGTTMNMSGTALFEGCVVLFVAQVFGVQLDLLQQATLVLLAVLSAVAVAGIPGGSLPLIAALLGGFGIPPEGIGIVIGVDRILDMTRTMVNVGSDLVTAVVVDRQLPKDEA